MSVEALEIYVNCNISYMADHVDEMLANGKSTGALLLQTPGGQFKLQVRRGDRGRGMFATRPVDPREVIATIAGHVAPAAATGLECWQLARNKFFVMNPCSRQHLGILANTAAGADSNNARYVSPRTTPNIMRLQATRKIAAGEEILASYGCGYAAKVKRKVRQQKSEQIEMEGIEDLIAPIRIRAGAAQVILCDQCGKRVTNSSRLKHARMCGGSLHW